MPLLTAVFGSWIFIIVFALMPKRLTLVEFIFVYFMSVIIMTSTFTLMDINLHTLMIDKNPEHAFAIIIVRTILIPTVFMVSANAIRKQLRWIPRLGTQSLPFFVLLGIQWSFQQMGVVKLEGWNMLYSCILFLLLTGVVLGLAWGFTKLHLAWRSSDDYL